MNYWKCTRGVNYGRCSFESLPVALKSSGFHTRSFVRRGSKRCGRILRRRATFDHRSITSGLLLERDIFVGKGLRTKLCAARFETTFWRSRQRPFSPNFLSLISKSGRVAEVTRFSRKTFFDNSDFSPGISLSLVFFFTRRRTVE